MKKLAGFGLLWLAYWTFGSGLTFGSLWLWLWLNLAGAPLVILAKTWLAGPLAELGLSWLLGRLGRPSLSLALAYLQLPRFVHFLSTHRMHASLHVSPHPRTSPCWLLCCRSVRNEFHFII